MYFFALPLKVEVADVGSTEQRAPNQKFDNCPPLYLNNRWTQCAVHPAIDGISIKFRYDVLEKNQIATMPSGTHP